MHDPETPVDAILSWQVGDIRVTKILEMEHVVPATFLLPEASAEALARVTWLPANQVDERGRIRFSVHALVLESSEGCILVDACVGNDKQDRDVPGWNGLRTPFLTRLELAGYRPESIDTVLCTHLHLDHVGWNTTLLDGQWRPTFPRARHLIARREMDHWRKRALEDREARAVLADSIEPIVQSGQVTWIEPPHQVCRGVTLIPTEGHTPGHVSVAIESRGERATISGDILHHPCQVAHPEWSSRADDDPAQAVRTRHDVLQDCVRAEALLFGTHFAEPSVARVRRDGTGFRLDPLGGADGRPVAASTGRRDA